MSIEPKKILFWSPKIKLDEGLKKTIISKTLKKLEGIGSKKSNLIIAFGPSIKGDKFQVMKKDVEDLIYKLSVESYIEKGYYIVEGKLKKEEKLFPLFIKDTNTEKLLFDIL